MRPVRPTVVGGGSVGADGGAAVASSRGPQAGRGGGPRPVVGLRDAVRRGGADAGPPRRLLHPDADPPAAGVVAEAWEDAPRVGRRGRLDHAGAGSGPTCIPRRWACCGTSPSLWSRRRRPRSRERRRCGAVNVLAIGKFEARKNHRLLLRALTGLSERHPIRATIIGECSTETHRRELAETRAALGVLRPGRPGAHRDQPFV